MARCIECRAEFNRAISKDKLRCPKCDAATAGPAPEDRTLSGQLKKVKKQKK